MAPRAISLFVLLASCGGASAPKWSAPGWVELARRAPVPADYAAGEFTLGGASYELVQDGAEPCIRTQVERSDWRATETPGRWVTRLDVQGIGRPSGSHPAILLRSAERELAPLNRLLPETEAEIPFGAYKAHGSRVYLRLGPGEEPPLSTEILFAARHESHADGLHRVRGRRFSGNGFAVWPGSGRVLVLDVPPASQLTFATTAEALEHEPEAGASVVFRVSLDDELLLEQRQELDAAGSYAWHNLDLPPRGRTAARLSLTVEGPAAYCAFLAPVVSAKSANERRHRAEAGERPDLALFLADTFRADNMTAYGGALDLTPNLDQFARGGLVFRRAWSVSTHTLPAHGSLFTGLFPRQTGIMDHGTMIASELETLAEFFAQRGYRTGAITDAAVVSQHFGMAQGFEWFDEHRGREDELGSTIARARDFLSVYDGRPTLLFIHSYRAHSPYRVSDEMRRELADRLEIDGDYETWDRVWRQPVEQGRLLDDPAHELALSKLRNLYLGGVADVDRGFVRLREMLTSEGLLPGGYFVFTSDHGEAFGEHEDAWHSGAVFDEQSRVPLVVQGPGIEPAVVDWAASLIDLPPTLAALAGLAAPEAWLGTPLLELDRERPIFLFQCRRDGGESTWGVVDQGRKVIGLEHDQELTGGLLAAFELERDPAELEDVRASARWPEELLERYGATLAALLVPLVGTQRTALDAGHEAQLKELGY